MQGAQCGEYDSPALVMTLGPGFSSVPKLAASLVHPQSSKTHPIENTQSVGKYMEKWKVKRAVDYFSSLFAWTIFLENVGLSVSPLITCSVIHSRSFCWSSLVA